MKKGLVVKAISSFFYVNYESKIYECRASNKLKLDKSQIITGDYVMFDEIKNYIYEICEREHELIRPKLANVKKIMLIFSALKPKMNYGLLDRMLLVMEKNRLDCSIIITKTDLMSTSEYKELFDNLSYYEEIGYKVFDSNKNIELISDYLKLDKYVFTGQTGVGKSTLINKLIPNLDIETQEISKALGRGKHTTREVTFYNYQNGFIIDTPGFSALDLDLTIEDVRDNYIDFFELSNNCKYNTCFHDSEPKCCVKSKLNQNLMYDLRYKNYIKFINEIKEKR